MFCSKKPHNFMHLESFSIYAYYFYCVDTQLCTYLRSPLFKIHYIYVVNKMIQTSCQRILARSSFASRQKSHFVLYKAVTMKLKLLILAHPWSSEWTFVLIFVIILDYSMPVFLCTAFLTLWHCCAVS